MSDLRVVGDLSYDTSKILGDGSFGTLVFSGFYKDSKPVAVKRVQKLYLRTELDILQREVKLMQAASNHENILHYMCTSTNEDYLFIAIELCGGTLEDYLNGKYQGPRFRNEKEILCQVTGGLVHLHQLKIVHRDIKPRNLLIFAPFSDSKPQMKLADFGISKILKTDTDINFTNTSMTNPTGSKGWMAPEVYESNRFDFKVDVWALGLIFFYTLSGGKHPFGDDPDERTTRIKKKEPMMLTENDLIESINVHEAFELIESMLVVEPKNRLTVKDVLDHSFLRDELVIKEVLEERKYIIVIIEGLNVKMKMQLNKMEELRKSKLLFEKHSVQINANKYFKCDVIVSKGHKTSIIDGKFTTNCSKCLMTCHFPCTESADKQKCCVIDTNGFCTFCPGKCKWDEHKNQHYHWVFKDVTETRTHDDIKNKYEAALKQKLSNENVLQALQAELDQIKFDLKSDQKTFTAYLQRLEQIAFAPGCV